MKDKVIIKQFKNKANKPVAGLTPEHAVYDANGVRLDAKLGNVNLQDFRDLQQQGVNNIKAQQNASETYITNKVNEAKAEIDAKHEEVSQLTQASMIGSGAEGLEGSNVEEKLTNAGGKLTELKGEVNGGGEIIIIDNVYQNFNDYYIDKNDGYFTSSSTGAAVAFYGIEGGKKYHISIPKTGNNLSCVLSYTNTIPSTGQVITRRLEYIGNSSAFDIELDSENYKYLVVCYKYSDGMPTVSHKEHIEREGLKQKVQKNIEDIQTNKENIEEARGTLNNISADLYGKEGEMSVGGTALDGNKYIRIDSKKIEGSSRTARVIFFPVENGKQYHLHIPLGYSYSSNVPYYAYSNDMSSAYVVAPSSGFIVADAVEYNADIVAENYKYLVVCFNYTGGDAELTYKTTIPAIFLKKEEVTSLRDVLYGKKIAVCGDSNSAGDFTGWTGEKTFPDGIYKGKNKVYARYIALRNEMDLYFDAISGSTLGINTDGADRHPFSESRYLNVPLDCNYIVLWFGGNDASTVPLGDVNDTDNTTFCGAWNVVLRYFITNIPFAKIGIIVPYTANEEYRNAVRTMAQRWGIPFLDMAGDPQVPYMNLKESSLHVMGEVQTLRRAAFCVSSTNGHMNPFAHEYQSTFIENWLRSL